MSSVNYKKMAKTARAGIAAIIAHNSTDTRIVKDHSNKDIDKSRTADNWQLYDMGYRDTYSKFLSRIKEIDSVVDENGKQVCNQRSNRIEAMYLEMRAARSTSGIRNPIGFVIEPLNMMIL